MTADSSLDDFMTVSNAQLCVDVFKRYMGEKFAFDVQDVDIDVKRLVFKVMTQVHRHAVETTGEDAPVDMKRMNNLTLNAARDFYVREYKLDGARRLEGMTLHRDKTTAELQGLTMPLPQERPDMILGLGSSGAGAATGFGMPDYEPITQVRQPEFPAALAAQNIKEQDCEPPDAMLARLSTVERAREEDSMVPPYTAVEMNVSSDNSLVARTSDRQLIPRYLSVNGYDRNWDMYKQRFRFAVDLDPTRHRQIHSIGITSMVVPMEISDDRTISNVPKQYYTHMFSFAFPYIVVNIDEFADVYEGTGDVSKRAFCQLVFESSYKSPSGRGYVILKPMQRERKYFYPTPLAFMNRLTFSVLRPNGVMFNQSTDGMGVLSMEWEPINPTLLKVVASNYFDKNEVYGGDTVRFKNVFFGYDESALVAQAAATNPVAEPAVQKYYYDLLTSYANRHEGHEVVNIGQPNDSGYYKTFYIQAPGSFDDVAGALVVPGPFLAPTDPAYDPVNKYSQSAIGALAEWNDSRWTPNDTTDYRTNVAAGTLMNLSLQVAISLQMMTSVDDAKMLMSSPAT